MANKKNKSTSGEYEVGRGKPPRHSRFKKGESGNPGGRKKGTSNLKTLAKMLAEEEVPLGANGKTVPFVLAVFKRQGLAALQGNTRAMEDFLCRMERMLGQDDEAPDAELPLEDMQILTT